MRRTEPSGVVLHAMPSHVTIPVSTHNIAHGKNRTTRKTRIPVNEVSY